MKKKSLFILLLVLSMNLIQANEYQKHHTVNAVLGDVSFVKEFGHHPDTKTNEMLRIKTHLKYVEELLRKKEIAGQTAELKAKRERLLDLLQEYRLAGNFPKNYAYPGIRIPCFIDKDGNICAVGYLIEQTAGRETAEAINDRFQYNYLSEMQDDKVNEWITNSGLTAEECAMIQPGYGYEQPPYVVSVGTVSWTLSPSKEEIALKKKVTELEEENTQLQHSLDSVTLDLKNQKLETETIQKKLEARVTAGNEKIKSLTDTYENKVSGLNSMIYLTSSIGFLALISTAFLFFRMKKHKPHQL